MQDLIIFNVVISDSNCEQSCDPHLRGRGGGQRRTIEGGGTTTLGGEEGTTPLGVEGRGGAAWNYGGGAVRNSLAYKMEWGGGTGGSNFQVPILYC